MKKLFFIFLLLTSFSCKEHNNKNFNNENDSIKNQTIINKKTIQDNNFQFFWDKFKKAIFNNDSVLLINMTNFPLKTHGNEDIDPQIDINKNNFFIVLKICLNNTIYDPIKDDDITISEYIEKTIDVTQLSN